MADQPTIEQDAPIGASCHPQKPVYARGLCRSCYDRARLEARPELKVSRRERGRAYYGKRQADHLSKQREAYRLRGEVFNREKQLKERYGLTFAAFSAMEKAQGGVCAICQRPPRGKSRVLVVDHDRKTGKVRALLCRSCNAGIGQLDHDPVFLDAAAAYMRRHRGD